MVKSFFILSILGMSSDVIAKDCGTHGVIYPIEEENPLVLIQKKLKILEKTGDLKRHNGELQRKAKAAIERPKPIPEITKATEFRVFYYDPSYELKEDIKDHQGRLIHKKGTRINPLDTVSLSQELIFFDGDDEAQKSLIAEKLKQKRLKLILIKGSPLALSEELKQPVYFDQGGTLTKKLGIHHVPATVSQNKNTDPSAEKTKGSPCLRIEEIKVGDNL